MIPVDDTAIDEWPAAMVTTPTDTPASESRKRSVEPEEDASQSKKQRTESPTPAPEAEPATQPATQPATDPVTTASPPSAPATEPVAKPAPAPAAPILVTGKTGASPHASTIPTFDALGKQGLRRSIALVLQSVGFDTARPEAMESFVVMAEEYMSSLIEEIKTSANSARRTHAVPRDYELALKRFNLTTTSLQPHRKTKKLPVLQSVIVPTFEALSIRDPIDADLPILSDELDGKPDKESKTYIPASFPTFPSIHTFKYTPETAEAFTVSDDWGSFNPDLPSQTVHGSQASQPAPLNRPLAPDEIPHGDPKKLREAAAKEAKAGEAALRRLVRASKIAKQKEVWTAAQRHPARRDRHNLWESAMRELLEEETRAKGRELAPAAMHGEQGRFEIADHSMIVNAEKRYHRHEVPRSGRRPAIGEQGQGKTVSNKA